jgi:hypothetical protein
MLASLGNWQLTGWLGCCEIVAVTHGAWCLSFRHIRHSPLTWCIWREISVDWAWSICFLLLIFFRKVSGFWPDHCCFQLIAAPGASAGGSPSGGATASPPKAAASSPMTATTLVAAVAAPLLAYCYLFWAEAIPTFGADPYFTAIYPDELRALDSVVTSVCCVLLPWAAVLWSIWLILPFLFRGLNPDALSRARCKYW